MDKNVLNQKNESILIYPATIEAGILPDVTPKNHPLIPG